MNERDRKINTFFPGLVVRKALVKAVKGNAIVPSYVLEYLLGQYCATDDEATVQSGIETVKEILGRHYVHRSEAGLVRANIKEKGRYKIIDKTGDLVGAKLVDNERKIMLITNEGIIIKMAVSDISIIGRNTSGVKLMSIDAESGIAVASIAKVRESDKDEDEEDEFLEEQDGEETESENTEDVMAEL